MTRSKQTEAAAIRGQLANVQGRIDEIERRDAFTEAEVDELSRLIEREHELGEALRDTRGRVVRTPEARLAAENRD